MKKEFFLIENLEEADIRKIYKESKTNVKRNYLRGVRFAMTGFNDTRENDYGKYIKDLL